MSSEFRMPSEATVGESSTQSIRGSPWIDRADRDDREVSVSSWPLIQLRMPNGKKLRLLHDEVFGTLPLVASSRQSDPRSRPSPILPPLQCQPSPTRLCDLP